MQPELSGVLLKGLLLVSPRAFTNKVMRQWLQQ